MYELEYVIIIQKKDKFEFNEVIKMIDVTTWMHNFLQTLNETFENRVWFVWAKQWISKNS